MDIISSVTNTTIQLRWQFHSGLPVDSYNIYWKSADHKKSHKTTINGTEFCETWAGYICALFDKLSPNTQYTFEVKTKNNVYLYKIYTVTRNLSSLF